VERTRGRSRRGESGKTPWRGWQEEEEGEGGRGGLRRFRVVWEVRMALLAGGFSLKELTEVSSCSPGSEMGVLEGWMGREGDGGGGGRSG